MMKSLLVVQRDGRERWNQRNATPLRMYERWSTPCMPAFIRHIALLLFLSFNCPTMIESDLLGPEAISATEQAIRPFIRRTPIIQIDETVLKLEYLQHAGSFKARGAFSNLLSRTIPASGVVAASGGNHGAAVAYAAMKLGVPAVIFVPTVSSPAKIALIESYGAKIVVGGDRYADALNASIAYIAESDAMAVHAFDSIETLRGPGTLAIELEEQARYLDTILVPVGGGGLLGGIAAWYSGRVKIVAVEPEGAPTLRDALAAGHPVDAPTGSIANDSLAPRRVGDLMFPLAQRFVDPKVVLVSDDDIINAREKLWNLSRIVAEPGGIAAYAALCERRYRPLTGERVCAIISGANSLISFPTPEKK